MTYTAETSKEALQKFQKDSSKRRLSGKTNIQGLEIKNKTTVGTGEYASVKLENVYGNGFEMPVILLTE